MYNQNENGVPEVEESFKSKNYVCVEHPHYV